MSKYSSDKCISISSPTKQLLKEVKKDFCRKKGATLPYSFIVKEALEALIEKEELHVGVINHE